MGNEFLGIPNKNAGYITCDGCKVGLKYSK